MKSFNQYIDEAAPRKSRKNLKWVVIMNYKDKKTGARTRTEMPILAKTQDEAFKMARESIERGGHKMISSMMKDHPTGLDETYNVLTVKGLNTQDLGVVYTWLKWGNAAKTGLAEKDPKWADQRDTIGAELGKRARDGDEAAKRALNNRMTKDVDKYGTKVKIPTSPPKLTLLQKIAKTLRGK